MIERATLGFLFRDALPPERVAAALAAALGVAVQDVAALDYEQEQAQPVLFQIVPRERGFRTDVTAFVDRRIVGGLDSLTLAERAAPRAGVDVLVSPPAS